MSFVLDSCTEIHLNSVGIGGDLGYGLHLCFVGPAFNTQSVKSNAMMPLEMNEKL